jgi:hypothetical protein
MQMRTCMDGQVVSFAAVFSDSKLIKTTMRNCTNIIAFMQDTAFLMLSLWWTYPEVS